LAETGEEAYSTIIARISEPSEARIARYIDMVEENVVREDLTFAEMAQVAITAAGDSEIGESEPEALVTRLYGNLHKMKRSYIRGFVQLLGLLGEDLKWPKDVSRNLGVEVLRLLKTGEADLEGLRETLGRCQSAEEQGAVLEAFLRVSKETGARVPQAPKEKFEFRLGATKVTARPGECRIVNKVDFTEVPRDQLEEAVRAFEAVLLGR